VEVVDAALRGNADLDSAGAVLGRVVVGLDLYLLHYIHDVPCDGDHLVDGTIPPEQAMSLRLKLSNVIFI
jgi:hypothetical protein